MFKSLAAAILAATALVSAAPAEKRAPSGIPGFDVSNYQGTVDMQTQYDKGARWVYIKATEGTDFTDSYFSCEVEAISRTTMVRLKLGSSAARTYFARPDVSGGASQAEYFLVNGGGWSADGITLPGALDIEYGPDGSTCYGLSASSMVSWIQDFSDTYEAKTGRYPTLSTRRPTGGARAPATAARSRRRMRSGSPSTPTRSRRSLATGPNATFWQYSSSQTPFPGDEDFFQGTQDGLQRYAKGS